ncbi:MAG: PAC2 family protein [Elusimicrobiota bacterium]
MAISLLLSSLAPSNMTPAKIAKGKGRERWLVTAWPGMGNVAVTAVVYLLSNLRMKQIGEFDARDLFELEAADVEGGLVHAVHLPRSRLFLAEDVAPNLDIVAFLGEAEPPKGKLALCQRLLTIARGLNVTHVCCFAAWASNMMASDRSRVHGIATDEGGLSALRRRDVTIVDSGRISGLSGVLLAVAAEQGLPGVGLLGEMPALALHLPYPSASAAVLRIFCTMTGMTLDLDELERYGRQMQEQLSDAYQQAIKALRDAGPAQAQEEEALRPVLEADEGSSSEDAQRVEKLFLEAAKDRAKAFELKSELDRLGMFRQYEDRFLGLFKER